MKQIECHGVHCISNVQIFQKWSMESEIVWGRNDWKGMYICIFRSIEIHFTEDDEWFQRISPYLATLLMKGLNYTWIYLHVLNIFRFRDYVRSSDSDKSVRKILFLFCEIKIIIIEITNILFQMYLHKKWHLVLQCRKLKK